MPKTGLFNASPESTRILSTKVRVFLSGGSFCHIDLFAFSWIFNLVPFGKSNPIRRHFGFNSNRPKTLSFWTNPRSDSDSPLVPSIFLKRDNYSFNPSAFDPLFNLVLLFIYLFLFGPTDFALVHFDPLTINWLLLKGMTCAFRGIISPLIPKNLHMF